MQKLISAGSPAPVRVVIVTLDNHLASAAERAHEILGKELPGIEIALHATATFSSDPGAQERCTADIARGDIIINSMLFMDEHIQAVLPALEARREHCDAMVSIMSAGEIVRLTRIGQFRMDKRERGVMALLRRLRGASNKNRAQSSGARQMKMLRRIPKILKFIPGTAQDVRAYFLTLQYWLAGSDDNLANLIRLLVTRYADGGRKSLRGTLSTEDPAEYPEIGLYHPRLDPTIVEDRQILPRPPGEARGTVGLLVMRSYLLAGNTAHYDAVIGEFEAHGLRVIPVFASGLDARPAIERYFVDGEGRATVDALVSLTGFSLVGGPAYNDAKAADELLSKLDIPYLAAHAVEFQNLEQWEISEQGLSPIEATIMVAIPELDGATSPMLFGGRSEKATAGKSRDMHPALERVERLVQRTEKLIALRKAARKDRRIGIVLFNFPPNAGSVGTAAFLSVFESLYNTLRALKDDGYDVAVPADVDELRDKILKGNAEQFGTHANVHARIGADDYVRSEPHLAEVEKQWGPAPGRHQSDGRSVLILGERFGNVFVGVQPAFGYEGDPMRLLFEKSFAPTHAFCAFYRYLKHDFGAHAVLHFGTHGALEFMPGKQTGLSKTCWPDRLIGDLPNFYIYAANNPSEGSIAKRRSAATLISYLTPPIAQAGLYRGLSDLKSSLERWRGLPPDSVEDRAGLASLIQAQASNVELCEAEPEWSVGEADCRISRLWEEVLELEYTLIPQGLHVVGKAMDAGERLELLCAMNEASSFVTLPEEAIADVVSGKDPRRVAAGMQGPGACDERIAALEEAIRVDGLLAESNEIPAVLHALDGGFVRPSPSGDLLRTPDILPTGRNTHGFDPFRMPSAFAVKDGARQAERLLERHVSSGYPLPRTIAMVLWGSDNLKSEGSQIAQALALMGARPRFDSYGRLCGAELISLEELGRPRVDVVITLSGIFRDLLPLQTRVLAEAAYLAAKADEPAEQNFIKSNAEAYQAEHGCDLEEAALRVFSNAEGAYGSNVNHLIENSCWQEEAELADAYMRRKGFAYARNGTPIRQPQLLQKVLSGVSLSYQNLESVELGVTTIDHYFDTLGGISRAASRARGEEVPVYIGDQTRGGGVVRTLSEQIALETRTRTLNPKWYEGLLNHGYEGVRQIESHITNTVGWSATTGQVAPWVYQQITQTFVLDPEMRERLAALNPTASAKVASRLLEAHERNYWNPDDEMLLALREAGEELEDRLEGIGVEAAA